MEQVVDKLIKEMQALKYVLAEDGGFDGILDIQDVKLDDPGFVTIDEYPYIFVQPIDDLPKSETAGRAGYDVRTLFIQIGVVVNQADYFNPLVSEVPGTRELMQISKNIRRHLRRLGKSKLDGEAGAVRGVVVAGTSYPPSNRGGIQIKGALTTLTVEKQYQHEE